MCGEPGGPGHCVLGCWAGHRGLRASTGRRPGPGDQMVLFTGEHWRPGQRAWKSLQLALLAALPPDVVFCWKITSANPAGTGPRAAGGGPAGAEANAGPRPLWAQAGGGWPGGDSEAAGREPTPARCPAQATPDRCPPSAVPRAQEVHRSWLWAPG